MSSIKIKSKEHELKYSFNSFKYMQDFDVSAFEELDKKPFKILPLLEMLLMGALNSNPKIVVKETDVQDYLENFIGNDGDMAVLLETLMQLLQDSSFFKSLQKK